MNKGTIIPVVILVILFVVLSNVSFLDDMSRIELSAVQDELEEVSRKNIVTIRLVFDEYLKTLELGANSLGTLLDINDRPTLNQFLKDIEIMGGFESVELIQENKYTYSSDGIESYVLDQSQVHKINALQPYITDVYFDEIHKDSIISIALPIPEEGKGYYLRGNISVFMLGKLLERNFSGEGRFFHIIDKNGSYVATTENSFTLNSQIPFFAVSELLVFEEGYSSVEMYDDFKNKTKGIVSYSMNDEHRYMFYEEVGINDWILASVLTAEVAEETAQLYRKNSYSMVARTSVLIIAFALIILLQIRKSHKNTQEFQECIEALAVQTHKVIFEWDYKKSMVIPHSNYKKVFGENFSISMPLTNKHIAHFIHKDDTKIFSDCLKTVQKKGILHDVQVRIRKADDTYIWCSISTVRVTDKKGNEVRTLGFVENIQEMIQKTEDLKKNAELDLLTGLYNKVTTERFISENILKYPKIQSALFIVDFDNFKTLNDSFGHSIGDAALKEISIEIKSLFRHSDIVGRVGGDEFFVFLLQYGTKELLHAKAKKLCTDFKKSYTKNGEIVEITFSVGIALFPEQGSDCKDLYKIADEALYKVKEAGKSGYCISGEEVILC